MNELDRLVTRPALTLLLAALTMSLGLLMPPEARGSPIQLPPVTIGFTMTAGLTLWLFISILTGTR